MEPSEKDFIKRLMSLAKCQACGQHYELNNIRVFGHQKNLWLVALSCSACHARHLAMIRIEEDAVPNIVTDLTEAELEKFSGQGLLTADDVLDMHNFLKDFDGDLFQLLSREET